MNRKGLKKMAMANDVIRRVINAPHKQMSTSEAIRVLRRSGVMDKHNNIKHEYSKILTKSNEKK